MADFILDKINESYYSIQCDNAGMIKELSSYMSFMAPNYFYSPKYKAGLWSGRINLFSNNLLPSGLLERFKKFLSANNYSCDYLYNREKEDIKIEDVKSLADNILKDWEHEIREDQVEAIHKSLRYKSGCLQNPTGSGKSNILYIISAIRMLQEQGKTLIVVPTVALVEQMYSDFADYGMDVKSYIDKIYSGQIQGNKNITIATWQSLIKRPKSYFEQFSTLLIDEVHTAKADSVNKIAKQCINADIRIGVTGTMPIEPSEFFSVCSFLGPVIFQQTTKDLIDKNILSDIQVINLNCVYPDEIKDVCYNRDYDNEMRIIESYPKRNSILSFIFDKAVQPGENAIVLVKHVDHLEAVYNYLKKKYPDKTIYKYFGEVKAEERESIRKEFESLDNGIIVGSYQCLSTGINIRKLHHVIFFIPYKSHFKVLQSIGRGLRLHATKSKLFLWDIIDDLRVEISKKKTHENHAFKHFLIRKAIYDKQGFNQINKKYLI